MKPYLILTPGRTGSNFLAKLLYEKQKLTNGIIDDPLVRERLSSGDFSIGHSLELFNLRVIQNNFHIILSYRENFIETVFSRCIANHFQIWIPNNEKDKKSFRINLDDLDQIVKQKTQWYLHYYNLVPLSGIDVVSYEVLMDLAKVSDWSFDNKENLIVNYDEAVNFIKDSMSEQFKIAHSEFVDCKAKLSKQNAYKLIT